MALNLTIGTGEGNTDEGVGSRVHYQDQWGNFRSGVISTEIQEEQPSELFEINNGVPMSTINEEVEGSVFSFDFHNRDDVVYVAVGTSEETSMDALRWTLNNAVNPSSTIVFLIHVFPEIKYIPTPLGKLPISQVNPEQKENYMAQERGKRREFLQKFLDVCFTSQVKVDTILIESDMEAKAILDLIPILNIRKLVLCTTKSNLRKMRSKKPSGGADEILQDAPEYCEVKIICGGNEITDLASESLSPSPSPRAADRSPKPVQEQEQINNDSFACGCFRPKTRF
ncbi:Adenine nucleotide alpha hydrolase-like superfamily protein [Forsythia ovata]|uniref:Adenine nucleotide alpha hydrolase-like superfamily protein n=1 Tax=Forsythia ovata TaxID=205694 RepID=A0ABD1S445_9LAMI